MATYHYEALEKGGRTETTAKRGVILAGFGVRKFVGGFDPRE
jgi:hypothetical protein